MSVESMSWALRVQGLQPVEKLVLLGIANHDGDGGSWPSLATLSMYASCSVRTVSRCVSRLTALGHIEVDVNGGGTSKTRGDRRPNHYTIIRPRAELAVPNGTTPVAPRPAHGTTPEVERHDRAVSTEPSMNHQENTIAHLPMSETSKDFVDFWRVWPKRVGQLEARKALDKAMKIATMRDILFGAEQVKRAWDRNPNERKFIPYPATWLNRGGWMDNYVEQTYEPGDPRNDEPVGRWVTDPDCFLCDATGWLGVEGTSDVIACDCRKWELR